VSVFGQIGADSFELFLVDPLDVFDLVGVVVDDFGSKPSSPATRRTGRGTLSRCRLQLSDP
jgi:hypothetical protein